MKLEVRLFARAKDIVGAEKITVDLTGGATINDLRKTLAQLHPNLAGLLERCALAVNNEFADDRTVLSEGAEIAILPPVSGG